MVVYFDFVEGNYVQNCPRRQTATNISCDAILKLKETSLRNSRGWNALFHS